MPRADCSAIIPASLATKISDMAKTQAARRRARAGRESLTFISKVGGRGWPTIRKLDLWTPALPARLRCSSTGALLSRRWLEPTSTMLTDRGRRLGRRPERPALRRHHRCGAVSDRGGRDRNLDLKVEPNPTFNPAGEMLKSPRHRRVCDDVGPHGGALKPRITL